MAQEPATEATNAGLAVLTAERNAAGSWNNYGTIIIVFLV
jgi:hypothetical protein